VGSQRSQRGKVLNKDPKRSFLIVGDTFILKLTKQNTYIIYEAEI
jgi:hypothetical protein